MLNLDLIADGIDNNLFFAVLECSQSMYNEKEHYIGIIRELLNNGANPNIKCPKENRIFLPRSPGGSGFIWHLDGGLTPLMVAIYPEVINLLVEFGADVNIQDKYGRTALMLHSFLEITNIVPILIKKGADINLKDAEGRTALFYAIWGPRIRAIETLIAHGININIVDNKGYTPLDIARIRYTLPEVSTEMIRMLTASGARNRIVIDNEKINIYRDAIVEYGWWPNDLYISYSDR
jgi:hypothetical protein